MFYFKINNGYIAQVREYPEGKTPPENQGWIRASYDISSHNGEKIEWFDKNYIRIKDEELVKKGIRKDHRGVYFNKDDRSNTSVIKDLDIEPLDNFTKEKPIDDEVYQFFDKTKNKWVVDTEKKEHAEKELELEKLKAEVNEYEKKIIRPMRAIQKGRATADDLDMFNKLDTEIENARPKITELEAELKIA